MAGLILAALTFAVSCGNTPESASDAVNPTDTTAVQTEMTNSDSSDPEAVAGLASTIDIARTPDVDAWCLGWSNDTFYQDGSDPAEVERVFNAILTAEEQKFTVTPDEIADDQAYFLIGIQEAFAVLEDAAWDEDEAMVTLMEAGQEDPSITDAVFGRLEAFANNNCG